MVGLRRTKRGVRMGRKRKSIQLRSGKLPNKAERNRNVTEQLYYWIAIGMQGLAVVPAPPDVGARSVSDMERMAVIVGEHPGAATVWLIAKQQPFNSNYDLLLGFQTH